MRTIDERFVTTLCDSLERRIKKRLFDESLNSAGEKMKKGGGTPLVISGRLKDELAVKGTLRENNAIIAVTVPYGDDVIRQLELRYGKTFAYTQDEIDFIRDTITEHLSE